MWILSIRATLVQHSGVKNMVHQEQNKTSSILKLKQGSSFNNCDTQKIWIECAIFLLIVDFDSGVPGKETHYQNPMTLTLIARIMFHFLGSDRKYLQPRFCWTQAN